MMEFVSWDHDILNIWKVVKFMFQTTNQILTIGVFAFLNGCSHFFLIRIWLESLKIEWLKSKKRPPHLRSGLKFCSYINNQGYNSDGNNNAYTGMTQISIVKGVYTSIQLLKLVAICDAYPHSDPQVWPNQGRGELYRNSVAMLLSRSFGQPI